MKKDWLYPFLMGCERSFDESDARLRFEAFRKESAGIEKDEIVRRYVEHRLRQTGVVYGTPLASEETIAHHTPKGSPQRWAVFLAILDIEMRLAMEISCALEHRSRGVIRLAEILVCLAVLCHRMRLARKLHALIPQLQENEQDTDRLLSLCSKLDGLLPKHAYLAGNPLLGLPIHNSLNYVDAKTLGRIAICYFELGTVDPSAISRILQYEDREKELLLRSMIGLLHADSPSHPGSARILAGQIKAARLPLTVRGMLLRLTRNPGSPQAVAAAVDNDRIRDFILEQVILGSMLDGQVSARETEYIQELAGWLDVSPEGLAEREAQVVSFYEQHRAYLDLFTVGTAVLNYRKRMLERLQGSIVENLSLIVREIKNTGELTELLYRASRGDKLSPEERRRMGKQLLDILRSIPSLAIFSLPGGAVLLPLLFKFLPDGLKPRSFTEHNRKKDEG